MVRVPTARACQVCEQSAKTVRVHYEQRRAYIVWRERSSISADMCFRCVNTKFLENTLITAVLGWCGVFSVFETLFVLPLNLVNYLFGLCGFLVPSRFNAHHITVEVPAQESS